MLRDQMLRFILTEWMTIAKKPDNDSLMGTPPSEITIFEFTDADFLKARCKGTFKAVESIDRDGKVSSPIQGDPRKLVTKYQKAFWEHALVSFHVNAEGSHAVVEMVYGPRYGRGYCFEVRDGFPVGSQAWIS